MQRQAKRALLSQSWKIEYDIAPQKCMSLSMMQLLSVLFKCKLHFLLFRLILEFTN